MLMEITTVSLISMTMLTSKNITPWSPCVIIMMMDLSLYVKSSIVKWKLKLPLDLLMDVKPLSVIAQFHQLNVKELGLVP